MQGLWELCSRQGTACDAPCASFMSLFRGTKFNRAGLQTIGRRHDLQMPRPFASNESDGHTVLRVTIRRGKGSMIDRGAIVGCNEVSHIFDRKMQAMGGGRYCCAPCIDYPGPNIGHVVEARTDDSRIRLQGDADWLPRCPQYVRNGGYSATIWVRGRVASRRNAPEWSDRCLT